MFFQIKKQKKKPKICQKYPKTASSAACAAFATSTAYLVCLSVKKQGEQKSDLDDIMTE
jgi:hypothetical protein